MSNFKAIGAFIFGGSATFGVENAGYKIEEILEMTDDMHLGHAYHFIKNRTDVPVSLPNKWENNPYMKNIAQKNVDLIFANCPCSSLSQINRNASVDGKNNVQFYRVFNIIKNTQPKAFAIENAPTLVKLGFPIILDCIRELGDDYKFTVIRDYGGSHGVPMRRMRTLLVGWRKDFFDNKIPLVHMNKSEQKTIKDAIGDLYSAPLGSIPNHELVPHRGWQEYEHLFKYVKPNSSIMLTMMDMWEDIKHLVTNKSDIKQIEQGIVKKSKGQNIWDKSPWKIAEDKPAPSLTSVSEYIHPVHNRQFTIREYARLMGYPDDFVFYPEESTCEIIQNIAQGVPAPLFQYIATEIQEAIKGNRKLIDDSENKVLCFQHHTKELYKPLDIEELNKLNIPDEKGKVEGLDADKSFYALTN